MKYACLHGVLVCSLLSIFVLASCITISTTPAPSSETETAPETTEPISEPASVPETDEPSSEPDTVPGPQPGAETPGFLPEPIYIPKVQPEPCCPCGTPPDKLEQYGVAETAFWRRIPSIAIAAKSHDPRIKLSREAVAFWNQQLAEMGSPFRFGSVTATNVEIPVDYLQALSDSIGKDKKPTAPPQVTSISANIIIALSDGRFISCSPRIGDQKRVVAIRDCSVPPLNLNNVQRNLIAHELGHTLGLGHNNDGTTLMCGRPAECGPEDYHCEIDKFFPLTRWEKLQILRLYPPGWPNN